MKCAGHLVVILFVLLTVIPSSYSATIAYWKFEENLLDETGNYSLTPTGSVNYVNDSSDESPGNYSISSTSGQYFTSDLTPPENNLTVEFFFKTGQSGPTDIYIFDTSTRTPLWDGFIFSMYNGSFDVYICSDSTSEYTHYKDSSQDYRDSQWHHAAFTLSETNYLKAYIDGLLFAEGQSYKIGSDQINLRFGAHNPNGQFLGLIDEVRISSGVLEASEFLNAETTAVPEPTSIILLILGITRLIYSKRLLKK